MFAHDQAELNPLPDLSRTKLCKTLIATGACSDPDCRYAHHREELRPSAQPEIEVAAMQQILEKAASQALQISQAHAAEAARLQAEVEQLRTRGQAKAQAQVPEVVGPWSQVEALSTRDHTFGLAPLVVDDGRQVMVKNTFLDVRDANDPPLVTPGLRQVSSASGRLDTLANSSPEMAPLTPAMEVESPLREEFGGGGGGGRAWPPREEPVQIHPGTLRSLSSNSLVSLGEDEPHVGRGEAPGIAAPDGRLLRDVKTGFGKPAAPQSQSLLEPAHVRVPGCLPGRLRSVRSAGGRLDALAEDPQEPAEIPTHRVLLRDTLTSPLLVPVTSPKLTQMDSPDISVLQTPLPDISSEMVPVAGIGDIGRQRGWSCGSEELPESVMAAPAPLRMVRTAAGRLDLMATAF